MLSNEDHQLYKAYYHTNTKYYIRLLENYQAGKKYSFIIIAFFIFYISYRKMWKLMLIFILLSIGSRVLIDLIFFSPETSFDTERQVEYVTKLFWAIVMGLTVNRFYIQYSIQVIQRIKRSTDDFDEQLRLAAKKGGVNWLVPFILVVLMAIYYSLSYL